MIAATQLRVVLVTPETTLLDEPVKSLQFPLFDGQIGVLPGRTPMVGRLGIGELRMQTEKGEQRYFVDGGFAQIKGSVVTLLTNRAKKVDDIEQAAAEDALAKAMAIKPSTDEGFAEKEQAIERARKQISLKKWQR
ncbi:MAG: ATP synthase F1 subunit epsilon [Planctomycetaceae bacterium]|nr:ATP synthase F1 subunit epsilon [Planctomycetaceae bacterium]